VIERGLRGAWSAGPAAWGIALGDDDVAAVEGGVGDGAAEDGGFEAATDGFDFGEFGHGGRVEGKAIAERIGGVTRA